MGTAVSAIPSAFPVLCYIFVYRMPLRMIQHAHFTTWLGVGGHHEFTVSLVFALAAFLAFFPIPRVAYHLCPGEFCRGLVEVFFVMLFHGERITRKRKESKA